MSFDTKYRPRIYGDVLGQNATVAVLKQFVSTGKGFNQSYVFCGSHGSGKTTLARILSRALLCDSPVEGEPCDQCDSCLSILQKGTSECYTELDAATKSGKDHILKITEELQYSSVSGKRRVYLFDESHQLSKQALDALLKPMEDTVAGSDDKQLVCIFCTTEPEKMRATIFSRCAPAFVIKPVAPEGIAERLAEVCSQEGLGFDYEALVLIAEAVDSHIRDALKAVEGISMLGEVSLENVRRYLRTDANDSLLDILSRIGENLGAALVEVGTLCESIAPTTAYERIVDACMLAYMVRAKVGKAPAYWNADKIETIGLQHGDYLLKFAAHMARRPSRATPSMLAMDIAQLHQIRSEGINTFTAQPVKQNETVSPSGGNSTIIPGIIESKVPERGSTQPYETSSGVYVDPRAKSKSVRRDTNETSRQTTTLDPQAFKGVLLSCFREINDRKHRSPG